jgi:hypothetical protein
MVDESFWRTVEGAGGVVFAVTLLISTFRVTPRPPAPDASDEEVLAHYREYRPQVLIAIYLHGVALIAYLFFIAGLWSVFQGAEGGIGRVAILAVVGGVGVNTVIAFSHVVQGTIAYSVAPSGNLAITRALHDIVAMAHTFFAFPVVVLYVGSAIMILSTGVLANWLGWVAIVLAVLQLVHGFAILDRGGLFRLGSPLGFASLLTFLVWVGAMGIAVM